jgi:outer membrane protein OmpA-like peptidoglycan-associated protein
LQPVSLSVLKEVNLACDTLLPSEPGIEAPAAPRGAGPASRRAESGSAPSRRLAGRQEFTVLYAFDDDYLEYAANQVVTEAAAYAQRIGASEVKISGYRATTILSNGNRLIEKAGLAEKRARNIAILLGGLGVSHLMTDWKDDAEPGDGVTDPSRRRVTIVVMP